MTDYSEAELLALKQTFPGIQIYLPYSALISRNLNFADSTRQSFRWINFAVPARYGCALMGIENFRWIIFVEVVVSAKIKSHEIKYYTVCDFPREQAWERWTNNHKHCLSNDEKESLLSMLRECANAPPADHGSGFSQDFYYQKAVNVLKASGIWRNNNYVRDRLETKWLCIPKVSTTNNTAPIKCLCYTVCMQSIECMSMSYNF